MPKLVSKDALESVSYSHSVGLKALFATEKKQNFLTFQAVEAILCGVNPVIITWQDLLVASTMVLYLRNQACVSPASLASNFFATDLLR